MRVVCHACRDSFEAPSGALSAQCPSCRARVTLTAMETRPAIGLVPAQSDAPPPESLLGRVLGGYTLRAVLGGGGMGVVYEAERTPDATIPGPAIAAVKVLSPAFSADPEFVERFRREADALIALRHPNLIEVYAKGEWSPEPGARPSYFFVMERFFGDDLRALLARGPVAPATVAAIVRGAAAGL
ncbi:hypothetical protein L6R52_19505, partial [Myxococcota bacterium]|nr:hypothetical protein [Myxococcota bacterium]